MLDSWFCLIWKKSVSNYEKVSTDFLMISFGGILFIICIAL